jgi:hypothetical protein
MMELLSVNNLAPIDEIEYDRWVDIEVQAFLLCNFVARNAQTGLSAIHGIFDQYSAESFPAIHGSCTVFYRLYFQQVDNSHVLALAIILPSGAKIELPGTRFTLDGTQIAEGTINLTRIPLPEQGRYEIQLIVDGHWAARYLLFAHQKNDKGLH